MQKVKKIPMRKCLGCNVMKPKKELIRIVRSPEGIVSIDRKGKAQGRGCYICQNRGCLDIAVKAKRLQKALETAVSEEVFQALKEQIDKDE